MKRICTILFVTVCIAINTSAQVPEKMNYQAVIRNSSNQLVINQAIGMKISIFQGTSNGTVIYQETYNPNPQTNANGLITVEIGGGLPIIGTFGGIDWSAGPYFIKTETDPNGGTNYTITGTSQLLNVPYALHAKTAETVTGGISETDPHFTSSPAANIATADIAKLSNLSGINTGDQDLSGFATTASVTTSLSGKIDKVTGKGLSTEDYTTAEKTKLAGLATGAEVNVQADWKQVTSIADDYIKNKPVNIDEDKTDDVITSGNQTIAGNKTFTGTITIPTPVNATDAANKAYVDAIKEIIYDELLDAGLNGIVKDIDGNTYKTVKIGDQIWMAENLAYLPYVSPGTTVSLANPHYYVYDYNGNDVSEAKATSNYKIYGVLYNWAAMMKGATGSITNPSYVQGVCPSGWHLPSDAEWKQLEMYLGMSQSAADSGGFRGTNEGGKLKEVGYDYWWSPNIGATNSSGFAALPGGYVDDGGGFGQLLGGTRWWSTTDSDFDIEEAWFRHVNWQEARVCRTVGTKLYGQNVRCVKD